MSNNTNPALVICGPSGVGKSTCIKYILNKYKDFFVTCISHTSRSKRVDEVEGINYYYVSREKFDEMIKNDEFIEYVIYEDNYYGTSKKEFNNKININGKALLIEIEIYGVRRIQELNICTAYYVFFYPDKFESLEKRLRLRATETEDVINKRITKAMLELEMMDKTPCDYKLINSTIEKANADMDAFILKQYKI